MSRTNFTEENLALTRAHIQALLDEGREFDEKTGKRKGKTKKSHDNVRDVLKSKGHKDSDIEKVIGDLDSYL